jgi:hypothetical protein
MVQLLQLLYYYFVFLLPFGSPLLPVLLNKMGGVEVFESLGIYHGNCFVPCRVFWRCAAHVTGRGACIVVFAKASFHRKFFYLL